ncbi:hypothetical protein J3R82DRAFT_10617 [Butyriboletus roseoflavus]|nr:hypothetical protein J3R82DRAFT_10617 [Butyriboletus roseoflavus]
MLIAQPHPSHSQIAETPISIRVSRTITDNALPVRLGLWGSADDTVTPLGHINNIQNQHDCLHYITWQPENGPRLADILFIIQMVHILSPRYTLLKPSCYTFARAIIEPANIAFNGTAETQQPHFLTRRSHFVWCIPAGLSTAQELAIQVVQIYQAANILRYGNYFYFYLSLKLIFMVVSGHQGHAE